MPDIQGCNQPQNKGADTISPFFQIKNTISTFTPLPSLANPMSASNDLRHHGASFPPSLHDMCFIGGVFSADLK